MKGNAAAYRHGIRIFRLGVENNQKWLKMTPVLSAELDFSTQEVIEEYFRLCEEAAERNEQVNASDARDFCRALDREYRLRSQQLPGLLNSNS